MNRLGLTAAVIVMSLSAVSGGCGDNLDIPGEPDPDTPDPDPEPDLEPGSFLSPVVQVQRLQGAEDHMHVDELRLRDDNLLFYCSYTFGVIDATDVQAMEYLSQELEHVVPDDDRTAGCIHLAWDDTDYDVVYTTHRGNIRNPVFLSGWDITDPEEPVQLPVLQEPGVQYEGIDVLGGNVFVGLRENGLGVYQRDPADNTLTRVGTAPDIEGAWGVHARADGIIFVADSLNGLVTVDGTDPANPTVLGRVATGGQARWVSVVGDIAYVAAGSAGVVIIDVSDLENPEVITDLDMPGSAIRLAVSEDLLYVAAWNDARVYDVSDPAEPRFIGAARVTQRDDDLVDPDRPASTQRVFGIAARGTDMFMGSWWVPHSFKVYPDRAAPSIRLPETYMQIDFGRVIEAWHKTLPFEVTNQGTAPLTMVDISVNGPFTVEPRQLRLEPGETGDIEITFDPTSSEMEVGYLKILSDDPTEPLRTAYMVGNQPGLGVGSALPETRAILLDGNPWSSAQVEEKVLLLAYFATF